MVVDSTVPVTLLLTGTSVVVALGHLLPGYLARSRTTARQALTAVRTLRCRRIELVDEPARYAVDRYLAS